MWQGRSLELHRSRGPPCRSGRTATSTLRDRRALSASARRARPSWARGRAGSTWRRASASRSRSRPCSRCRRTPARRRSCSPRRRRWRRSSRRAPAPRRWRARQDRRRSAARHASLTAIADEHVADGVVLDDRHPSLLTGVRVLERHLVSAPGDPVCDRRSAGSQQRERARGARPSRGSRSGAGAQPTPVSSTDAAGAARKPICARSRSSRKPTAPASIASVAGQIRRGEPRARRRRARPARRRSCRRSVLLRSSPRCRMRPARAPSVTPRGRRRAARRSSVARAALQSSTLMAMPPSPTASSSIAGQQVGNAQSGASVLLVEQRAVEPELDEQAPALGEDVLAAGVERRRPAA